MRHVQYDKIQISALLCAFKIFGLLSCQKSFRIVTRCVLLILLTVFIVVSWGLLKNVIPGSCNTSLHRPHTRHRHFSNYDIIADIIHYIPNTSASIDTASRGARRGVWRRQANIRTVAIIRHEREELAVIL